MIDCIREYLIRDELSVALLHKNKISKLKLTAKERDEYDQHADFYSIIIATEHLERQYLKSTVSPQEYTTACLQLIAQYKTLAPLLNLTPQAFVERYKITASMTRLQTGLPATMEHQVNTSSTRIVAEVVQFYITLLDSLRLGVNAVDEIHPQVFLLCNISFQIWSQLWERVTFDMNRRRK